MTVNIVASTERIQERTRRWPSCMLRGLALGMSGLVVVGIIYQAVGARADARNYPPPGQLVSVGDYRLHLHCMGTGSPTIILDTISGGTSVNWGWIQPELASFAHVCAYDRAGRGWSDPSVAPEDLWGTAENLAVLLHNAGMEGPYVLVGHSIGGLYARAFASQHPQDVVGLVLVDSAHPEQFDRFPDYGAELESFMRIWPMFPWISRLGLFRLYFATGGEIDFQDLPARQHAELAAFWSSPAYWINQQSENSIARLIFRQAQELPRSLGDLPLAIVTADNSAPSWLTLQAELKALSSNSVQVIVDDSTHVSLAFNQERAHQTSEAIRQVWEAAKEASA